MNSIKNRILENSIKKQGKIFQISIILLIIISIVIALIINENKNSDDKNARVILREINDICNSVNEDLEGNEEKYIKLLEIETDPLKRGMYASALVQINALKSNYEGMITYGDIAIENYLKVKNGELYVISEKKYLAWIMLKFGEYDDCIKLITEISNIDKENILTEEEIIDTEVLIYTIFINIYTEFNLVDEAKFYYDKLCEIEITPELEYSRGEKISISKMLYAEVIEDYDLMKKYADETYEILLKIDNLKSINSAYKMLINCAYANIKVGNLEEGFKQVQESEVRFIEDKDEYSLVIVYSVYGDYYNAISDVEKSLEYYNKAIDLSKSLNDDFRLSECLSKFIEIADENNMMNEYDEHYKLFFELTKDTTTEPGFNELLEEVFNNKELLNQERIDQEKRRKDIAEKSNLFFCGMIIILILLLIVLLYLLKIRNESEKKLEEIANRDFLTKTSTRAYGYMLIDNIIRNKRNFSVGIIDIDDFKLVNDTYGHLFGDEVLKKVAEILIMKIGKNNIIIRFGGEEFLVVLIDISKEDGKIILDKVREEVFNTKFENNINVSFSCGVEEWDNTDIENVICKADKLLYKCKTEGKNKICIEEDLKYQEKIAKAKEYLKKGCEKS